MSARGNGSGSWRREEVEVLGTLQDLVSIDSVNPDLPGGSTGEGGMVDYLRRFFADLDIGCELDEVLPGRHNVVATLPGDDRSRTLLFECHMDTASVEIMTIPPFEPHVREGLLYGRGSCDTKAGGAAMVQAMKRLRDAGTTPPVDIVFAGCVDEEHLMRGSQRLAANVSPTAAVIAEPTDLAVIRAHKGVLRFRVVVAGTAAHSSKPQLGVNAITKMAALIDRIDGELVPQVQASADPLLGPSTLNIGVIAGGQQVNFVPDTCTIDIDVRMVPGQTAYGVIEALRNCIAEAASDDSLLDATVEPPYFSAAAVGTDESEAIVVSAVNACREVTGVVTVEGVPYGTDGSPFGERGVPTVVLGPGSIDQAHGAVEWVECEQVVRAVDIYERIMRAGLPAGAG